MLPSSSRITLLSGKVYIKLVQQGSTVTRFQCPSLVGVAGGFVAGRMVGCRGLSGTNVRSTISNDRKAEGLSGSGAGVNKWDLFAGVVLERKPVIGQELSSMEKEQAALLSKQEIELSKKSDHEVRKEKDVRILDLIKQGKLDVDKAPAQTSQDDEDKWNAERQQFSPASRQTNADKTVDQKSLDRALDSHLLLVIEQKVGQDYKWVCPHGKWSEGENLRQTAERTLTELCPEVKAKVLGNAPWGFYKYKYPKKSAAPDQSSVGAKIFFYKAQVLSGELTVKKSQAKDKTSSSIDMKDFLWLTREELSTKLLPEYHKSISEFLVEETN